MFKKVFRVFGFNFVEVEKLPAEKKEPKLPTFRVVLCGDCNAGKSALWGGLVPVETAVDPSLRGLSLVKSAPLREEKCELSIEYLNAREPVMSVELEASLREVDCFLICFDWCSAASVAGTEAWIELAQRLSPDPTLLLVGMNFAELQPSSLPTRRELLESIKTRHFCFRSFEVKQQYHKTITRECAALRRMLAGDCALRREEARRRTVFRPLEHEPDWEFKLVG